MEALKLQVGDILVTGASEELYVYLGYYDGTPRSLYNRPDEGYLYVFIGSLHMHKETEDEIRAEILSRGRFGIDGNACYVKRPKKFDKLIGHISLDNLDISRWAGIARVGDSKPKMTSK